MRLLWLIKVPLEWSHVTFDLVYQVNQDINFPFPFSLQGLSSGISRCWRAIAPTHWRPGGNHVLVSLAFLGFQQPEINRWKITIKLPCPLSKKVFYWSLKIIGDGSFALLKRVSKTRTYPGSASNYDVNRRTIEIPHHMRILKSNYWLNFHNVPFKLASPISE